MMVPNCLGGPVSNLYFAIMMGMIGDDGYDRYDGFGHLPHRLEQGTPKKKMT